MEEEEAVGLDTSQIPDDPGEAIAEASAPAPEPVGVVNASTTASLPTAAEIDPTAGEFNADDWALQEDNDVTYRMYSKKGDQTLTEQQQLFSQLMEDEQEAPIEVETYEVIKRGFTDGTLVTALDRLYDDVSRRFTDPEYFKEDPEFKVTDEMLEGYQPHQQADILNAVNERQAREAQARAERYNETQAMVANAGWGAWLGNMGATFLVEGGLAMGGGIASGGLNLGSKIGAKLFSGAIKNSRVLGAVQAGTAGALGAGAQGTFEMSQGVISAQEAAVYPVMGLMFGGALGGVFPHAVGDVAKKMGVKQTLIDDDIVDPMMAKLEEAEIAVARVQAAAQAEGAQIVPGQAKVVDFNKDTPDIVANAKARKERPDLDPDEWVHGNDTDMAKSLADMTDDMDVDIAPQSRRILWEEDLVQRVRDPEVAEEATRLFDKDLDVMDGAFAASRPNVKIGWSQTMTKVAKSAGEAFRRQGYRFEPTGGGKSQKLYMVDHGHNHTFSKESGQGIRHAYEDPAHAAKYADGGARIVEIEVPAGAKVIEGQGLSPAVGTHGEFMIGDGIPHRRADGTYEWRPNKEVVGNKQIISGKGHDGVALSPADILYHNKIQGTRAKNGYSDTGANRPGAGVGANIIARREFNMDQSANAQDFLANPNAGIEKQGLGINVTRAGIAQGSDNPMARTHAPDLLGSVKDLNRKNLELDVYGSSVADKVGRMNGNDNSAINVAEQQAYVKWIKWNNENGVKMSKDPLRKEMEFRQAMADLRNARHDAHHFGSHRAGQDAQVYYNQHSQNPGLKALDDFYEGFYAKKAAWMKDPGDAIGEPGRYESVGGAADMGIRQGYQPFFPDLSQLKAWEAKGFHGGIYQVYRELLTKKFVGEGMSQMEAQQMGETIGRIYSDALMARGGNTGFDVGHLRMATSSENLVVIMKQMGVGDTLAQQLKAQVDKMMANSDASFSNVMERLHVPLTEKVPVKHYQNPSLTQPMSLSDFMLKNPNATAKVYGRKSNGWVALATTARRDSKGNKLTHDIPEIDPATNKPRLDANGKPIMKTVPWTLRNQQEVDKFLRDLKAVGEELNVDANTKMERRKVAAVYEEAIDAYLNRSKENPHELMQAAMNANLARTMGAAGWSSIQELGMLSRIGIHGWQETLSYTNLMRDLRQAGKHIWTRGKAREPEDAHSALGFVTGHNMGTAERSNIGNQNTQFDNSQLALVGTSTGKLNKGAIAHRAQQKLTEAVMKYGGLLPLQDALQYRAGLAYLHKIGKMAKKYKSAADLPRSKLVRLKRMGMTSKDIDQIFNFLNGPSVTRKRGDFGVEIIDQLDSTKPGFDSAAHTKLGDAIYRTVTKNVIMEQKAGAKFPGMDTTVMSMFTQLQSFQMASMSQMMNNYMREWGEAAWDIGKGMKDGNWGAKDGVLDGVRSFVGLGGTLAFAMGGAIGVEILKQEWNNKDQDDKYKEKMRENWTDTNWLINTGIDKAGIFSFIPWMYDSFAAPITMANGWSGYKDYDQKNGGLKGVAEHFALNNLTGDIPKDFTDAGKGLADIASGKGTSGSYQNVLGAFTNMWVAKEALNMALKAGGVEPKKKKIENIPKPKPLDQLKEGAKKVYKQEIKRSENVYNYWFGGE